MRSAWLSDPLPMCRPSLSPLAPLERLHLARSDYVADYSICWNGSCRGLAELVGPPATAPEVELFACPPP